MSASSKTPSEVLIEYYVKARRDLGKGQLSAGDLINQFQHQSDLVKGCKNKKLPDGSFCFIYYLTLLAHTQNEVQYMIHDKVDGCRLAQ